MITDIEGLSDITGPVTNDIKGDLVLPNSFNTSKYVAKWVKEGTQQDRAMRPESFPHIKKQAEGWAPWLSPVKEVKDGVSSKPKSYTVKLQGNLYVLMCRPRELQRAVNGFYSEISKSRVNQESAGDTVDESIQQEGILSNRQLEINRLAPQFE